MRGSYGSVTDSCFSASVEEMPLKLLSRCVLRNVQFPQDLAYGDSPAHVTRDDLDTHSLSDQGLPLHRPQYGDWDDTANRYS